MPRESSFVHDAKFVKRATTMMNEVAAWRSGSCEENGCWKLFRELGKAVVAGKVDVTTKGMTREVTITNKSAVEAGVDC